MELLSSPTVAVTTVAAAAVGFGGWLMSKRTPSEDALLTDWTAAPPPWLVLKFANGVAAFLDRLRDAVTSPPIRVFQQVWSYTRAQVLGVLAHAKIADHLASGPKTAAELAALTGLDEAGLFWVLRLAVAQNLLGDGTGRSGVMRFRNNAISATLRDDHPNCTRYMVLHQVEDCYPAWSRLWAGLQSGRTPWDLQHPTEDPWTYFRNNPELEKNFSTAMISVDNIGLKVVLADYDFSKFSRVVDVGGALGSMLAAVLRQQPHAIGILFDLPQVVERAVKAWGPGGQFSDIDASRIKVAPGSFFDAETIPAAKGPSDLYVMRAVLHDWSDEKTVEILTNVRNAIGYSGATLVILEVMPPDTLQTFGMPEFVALSDMHMLTMLDGMERTKSQWEALFKQTGFKLAAVRPTRSLLTITEANGV